METQKTIEGDDRDDEGEAKMRREHQDDDEFLKDLLFERGERLFL